MAWVEAAEQCEKCGSGGSQHSWYGQVHRVPFAAKTPDGAPVIHWPTRAAGAGGSMSMGSA